MRVAVVTTSWPRFEGDPSGHFVAAEVRALTRCGVEVVEVVAPSATTAAFGWPGFAARVQESPLRLAGALGWMARARGAIARGRFDRIIAHWAVPCAWPIVVTAPSAPMDVVSHGGDVRLLTRLPRAVRSAVVESIVSRASRWRFVSRGLADDLMGALPPRLARRLEERAVVEPCAIEVPPPSVDAIEAKRAAVGVPFAVCVARLVASKRVDAAIDEAKRRGLPLVVVGDGPERAALERHARRAQARVVFAGRLPRADVLAWMAASAALIHASRAEGASTVLREAEALSVPIVLVSPATAE